MQIMQVLLEIKYMSLFMLLRHTEGVKVQLHSFLTLIMDEGELSSSSSLFTPEESMYPKYLLNGGWGGPVAILDTLEKR